VCGGAAWGLEKVVEAVALHGKSPEVKWICSIGPSILAEYAPIVL